MDRSGNGMAGFIRYRGRSRFRLVGGVVGLLPHASKQSRRNRDASACSLGSRKDSVCLAVHIVESFRGSGLVLLHLLVPAVPEGRPRVHDEGDWSDGLDTLFHRGNGKPGGWTSVQRLAEVWLIPADCSPGWSALLLSSDGSGRARSFGPQFSSCHCTHFYGDVRLLWRPGKRSCDPSRPLP